MTEVRKENPDLNPESMLDFGGGPGTAVSAAWEVWGTQDSDELDEDPQGGRDRRAEGESANRPIGQSARRSSRFYSR